MFIRCQTIWQTTGLSTCKSLILLHFIPYSRHLLSVFAPPRKGWGVSESDFKKRGFIVIIIIVLVVVGASGEETDDRPY